MTFQRMADRRPVETVVERDDGVVFAMRGAGGGADLPHDLVHAVVEAQLRVPDGIWGSVADGVVWRSMRHVSGRQPPHAAERSARLKRERAARIQRAESLADLVGRMARAEQVLPQEVAAAGVPLDALEQAAGALREASRHWAGLPPGASWVFTWTTPSGRRVAQPSRHRPRSRGRTG